MTKPNDIFCYELLSKLSAYVLKHVVPEMLTIMDKPLSTGADTSKMSKWCL